MSRPAGILAAGGVLWRGEAAAPEVALVHRPRYRDWSLPKGKALPGEPAPLTAVREVREETGHRGRLGRPLGRQRYLRQLEGGPVPKTVQFWAMASGAGEFRPNPEVDELRWLTVPAAGEQVTLERDRAILRRFRSGPADTVPVLLVRHASAGRRDHWGGPDRERPLDEAGRRQAAELVPLLGCYAPRRVLSADVVRCLDTVAPFARAHGLPVHDEPLFSEEGHGANPQTALRRLLEILADGEPTVVCSQGEVIPDLLERLSRRQGFRCPARLTLAKGSFWAAQVTGGEVATLEHHRA